MPEIDHKYLELEFCLNFLLDFKNMKLIGGLLRNCGAFYMKRSFRSDELYWVVFSEYVQCLLLNSGTTMEFFLEGTRSRSGKSLHPKQGLFTKSFTAPS